MAQLLPDGLLDPEDGQVVEGDQTISYGETWVLHLGSKCSCSKEYPHLAVSSGRVQRVSGIDTLIQWVRFALLTERFRFPIYSDDYGAEFGALIQRSPTPEEVETEAPRIIREALSIDPRVLEVRLVKVEASEEDPASYFVDMEVISFTGDLESISATTAQLEE